jgi:hypothetical protein
MTNGPSYWRSYLSHPSQPVDVTPRTDAFVSIWKRNKTLARTPWIENGLDRGSLLDGR